MLIVNFSLFANTVTTINYQKPFRSRLGGIMFQAQPGQEYSEIVLHVKFKENDATLQQETLGNLGVNLVYGAFHFV